jgi:hypothetical protein
MEESVKFFSIWIGGKIPENAMQCFEENKTLPGFYIISDRDIPGFTVVSYQSIIDEIGKSEFKELRENAFKRVIESEKYSVWTAIADFIRFYICATRNNVFYVDADAVFFNTMELKTEKPLFADYGYNKADVSLIYNAGNKDFFRWFLEETSKFPRERGLFYGWLNTKTGRELFEIIPYEEFVHEGAI